MDLLSLKPKHPRMGLTRFADIERNKRLNVG